MLYFVLSFYCAFRTGKYSRSSSKACCYPFLGISFNDSLELCTIQEVPNNRHVLAGNFRKTSFREQ